MTLGGRVDRGRRIDRFEGWIAGLGTAAGTRLVIGHWARSPLGSFTDVMIEWPDGERVLLAPTPAVATFVSATYCFDHVQVVPVSTVVDSATRGAVWRVWAGPLRVSLRLGRRSPLGMVLRAVPSQLATRIWWISIVDVIARTVLTGVRTKGSARGAREEFYAARDLHTITTASVSWNGVDQGALAPIAPPVRFGFGSTPRRPCVVWVTTLITS